MKIVNVMFGLMTLAVAGCATHIPVSKETGDLNLRYQTKFVASERTGKAVGVVFPVFIKNELTDSYGANWVNQSFARGPYGARLGKALQDSILEVLSGKGFSIMGPYPAFDEMPYGDKKTIYLAAVPALTIFMDVKATASSCKGMVCTERGTFYVSGELLYKMVEPMTGQALLTRRINLSDFGISRNYRKDRQVRHDSDGILGMALDRAMNPESLQDDTDRVMAEAMSEFFQKAMEKIDAFISREELLSFEQDISQLKSLKRF